MLKKRLIGVITIKDGLAVQSFGYKKYLPIGKPEIVAENLDRWGIDEIIVQCIDRSIKFKNPDLISLAKIANKGISTPIIYSGGIKNIEDASRVISTGAERICIDSCIHDNIDLVKILSNKFGAQALILSLPVTYKENKIYHYDYTKKVDKHFDEKIIKYIENKYVSELLLIDYKNEGYRDQFNFKIIKHILFKDIPFIIFGGITEKKQYAKAFSMKQVSAVATGNTLSYKEHAVQKIRDSLNIENLRQPLYEKKNLDFIINDK